MTIDLEKFVGGLHEYLAKALGPVGTRLAALDARITELERLPFTYAGPHETNKIYERGMFVTVDGSLWHCNDRTASIPGDGSAWTLAVKRGRDTR